MVKQINNRLKYYKIVHHYRKGMDMDLCEMNGAILEMKFGIEV